MITKRLSIIVLVGILSAMFWTNQSNGHQSSLVQSVEHEGVVHLLDEAYNGDLEAQLSVAYSYLSGDGIEENVEKSAEWFEIAAKNGSPQAQMQLGLMYFSGSGVKADQEEAFAWVGKAAAQEYDPAFELLDWMSKLTY